MQDMNVQAENISENTPQENQESSVSSQESSAHAEATPAVQECVEEKKEAPKYPAHEDFDVFTVEAVKENKDGKVTITGLKIVSLDGTRKLTEDEADDFNDLYDGAQHHGQRVYPKGERKIGEIVKP